MVSNDTRKPAGGDTMGSPVPGPAGSPHPVLLHSLQCRLCVSLCWREGKRPWPVMAAAAPMGAPEVPSAIQSSPGNPQQTSFHGILADSRGTRPRGYVFFPCTDPGQTRVSAPEPLGATHALPSSCCECSKTARRT